MKMPFCSKIAPKVNVFFKYLLYLYQSRDKMVRSYNEELTYLEKISNCSWRVKKGFVPNMKVRNIKVIHPGANFWMQSVSHNGTNRWCTRTWLFTWCKRLIKTKVRISSSSILVPEQINEKRNINKPLLLCKHSKPFLVSNFLLSYKWFCHQNCDWLTGSGIHFKARHGTCKQNVLLFVGCEVI